MFTHMFVKYKSVKYQSKQNNFIIIHNLKLFLNYMLIIIKLYKNVSVLKFKV